MNSDLSPLEEELGYHFRERTLLSKAVFHPSFKAESREVSEDNQRLEFLGDAVLQLSVTELLFQKYSEYNEGLLSRMRAALTNESTLAQVAEGINLGHYLFLGKGEDQAGGRVRRSNLADALEALFGAIHLDGGFVRATEVIQRLFPDLPSDPEQVLSEVNPKGRLQELTQARFQTPPVYETRNEAGPTHQPEFEVLVSINGQPLASSKAGNRKEAEKKAAREALKYFDANE